MRSKLRVQFQEHVKKLYSEQVSAQNLGVVENFLIIILIGFLGKKRLGKTVMDVVKEGKLKKVKKSKKKISEPMEVEES